MSTMTDAPAGIEYALVHVVFELSKAKWQLGVLLPGTQKMSRYTIDGGDLAALSERLSAVRSKAGCGGKPVRILACYEAGLDGHWLHRWLSEQGVTCYEVDPSSMEVNRRARRAKTDRIDLDKLMRTFLAYLRGEPGVCSMVHVPSVEEEDRKRRTRERDRLLKERTAHTNRIKGLLHGQGVRDVMPLKPGFIAVSRSGRRFVDESSSYHDFVPGMVRASEAEGEKEAAAWLIADAQAVRRWGMGFVRPFPVPKGQYIRNGYLMRANTLAELAAKAGIDPAGLEATVKKFNGYARNGVDPEFNRGNRTYDRYQGDEEVQPNPCLAPLEHAPYYAVRLYAGEIGTFAGIRTDAYARVVGQSNEPIPGLYAAGNDQVNVFGGAYPGAGATLGPAMTFGYIAGRHAAGVLESGVSE